MDRSIYVFLDQTNLIDQDHFESMLKMRGQVQDIMVEPRTKKIFNMESMNELEINMHNIKIDCIEEIPW